MSTHIHLLRHPEWTGFQETLMGLDGKSLWLTIEGHRKGPYRMVIVGSGMGSPACRRYAIELVPGMPDESRSLYLDPRVAGHITGMRNGRGKMMELDLDAIVPSVPT